MSRFPSWHFREMDPGEVHVDPVHDEFFKMQDLADALVREAIQNSMDARRGRGPVRVRFRFATGREALHADAARHYLHGLREHIEAASATLHSAIPLVPGMVGRNDVCPCVVDSRSVSLPESIQFRCGPSRRRS